MVFNNFFDVQYGAFNWKTVKIMAFDLLVTSLVLLRAMQLGYIIVLLRCYRMLFEFWKSAQYVVSETAGCEWDTAPTVADRTEPSEVSKPSFPRPTVLPVWAGQTDVASPDGYSVREAAWTACHAHVTPPQARSAVPDVPRFAHRHNAPLEIRAGIISLKT